jgi:hypothetical protein
MFPAFMGGMFPSPSLIDAPKIKGGKYEFTDPIEFAREYGEFSREEILKNAGMAQDLSLQFLDTELKGLQQYAPAASAIAREQTAQDNLFNQAQRDAQIEGALPGVRGQLQRQGARAETYAGGGLPSELEDRALELGIRSRSADRSTAAGFGARSSVAQKSSDLMSTEQRLQIAQYGEQLLGANIGQQSDLLLAPTQYAQTGSQIRVMPEVSASRMAQQAMSELNALSTIPAGAAFSAEINQQQFGAQMRQRTQEFNAGNTFAASQFNAGAQNQFALSEFGYNVGYATSVAGAAQQSLNTELALQQQQQAQGIFQDYQGQAQQAAQAGSIAQGIAAIPGIIAAGSQAISAFSGPDQGRDQAQVSSSTGAASVGPPPQSGFGIVGSDPNFSGGVVFESPNSVPTDYTGVVSYPDGTVGAVPNSALDFAMSNFSDASGIPMSTVSSSPPVASAQLEGGQGSGGGGGGGGNISSLLRTANAVNSNSGMSTVQYPGMSPVGVNKSGTPVYANTALLQNPDPATGNAFVSGLQNILDPLGVYSNEDASAFQQIGQTSSDAAFIGSLTAMQRAGNSEEFINTILNRYGHSSINALQKGGAVSAENASGLHTAFASYQAFNNWDKMSPAQKGLALSTIGVQGYKFGTGENLGAKVVPGTQIEGYQGLTVGQALGLFQSGVNVYSLVQNWDQMNDFSRVTYGTTSVANMAQTAKQLGMLGAGTQGAAVPGVTAQTLAQGGWTVSPHLGVGAVTGSSASSVPAGYTATTLADGTVVAIPQATAQTSTLFSTTGGVSTGAQGAGSAGAAGAEAGGATSAGSLLGTAAGVAGLGAGAYTVYENWGSGGTKGAVNGALGGAAMAAGLYALGASLGPVGWAGIIAVAAFGGAIKTGKHEDQMARDGVRGLYRKVGLMGKDDTVTLADGTKVNLGIDGKNDPREFRDVGRVPDADRAKKPLYSYDTDFTNDLDYFSGMAGISLSRIISGGRAVNIDQMGGQLGNAALGNIGFQKDMSEGNFKKMSANMRALYAQAGIGSKADAFALANQAYSEGRLDDTQLLTAHQSFNMVFDDRYDTAQKLSKGRWAGIEVAAEKIPQQTVGVGEKFEPRPPRVKPPQGAPQVSSPFFGGGVQFTPEMQNQFNKLPQQDIPRVSSPPIIAAPDVMQIDQGSESQLRRTRASLLSREEIVALNRERYALSQPGELRG